MRVLLWSVIALLLVGCVGSSPRGVGPTAHAAVAGWSLDCGLGAVTLAEEPTWRQECLARASSTSGSKTETWLAIDPRDPNNVVIGAKDLDPESSAQCVWNGVFVTHDGGRTWRDVVVGGKYAERSATSPFYGYACNTDPMFRFTQDGALHFGVEMMNFMGNGPSGPSEGTPLGGPVGWKILLATSHDGGDTWPDVITFQPDVLLVTDYSRMAIDPVSQAILEVIVSDESHGCHVLSSLDGGRSARPFAEVQTRYGAGCDPITGVALAVSPHGVATMLGGNAADATPENHFVVSRSTDDGLTWLDSNPGFPFKPIVDFIESKYRVGTYPELAYDLTNGKHAGTLYVAYAAADRDEADVFVRSSRDDGRTWSDASLVNGDGPGAHQWMPNVAVAGDGSVHVFYFDKSDDPTHRLIDVVHAVSMDGVRWSRERVTTVSFDGDLGVHQTGVPFIGDYLGVACGASDCWAAFPDSSSTPTTVVAVAHVHKVG